MNRRWWLACLLLPLLSWRKPTQQPQFFTWVGKQSPFTTDPRYAKVLTYGKHQQVFCNGEDVSDLKVHCCMTGLKGWVVIYVAKKGKEPEIGKDGELKTHQIFGDVEYVDNRRLV